MPTALYPAVRSIGTNPPSGPHPISTTSAGEAGNLDRTNGHTAASHLSSEDTPPEPTPDLAPAGLAHPTAPHSHQARACQAPALSSAGAAAFPHRPRPQGLPLA